MGKIVKIKAEAEKVCPECGGTYTGSTQNKTCSKWCAFWRLVDKSGGPDACWLWRGYISPSSGYGGVGGDYTPDGKRGHAHRTAWWLHNLCDPDKLYVLHKCDNPICCNPKHLRIGSQRANIVDGWSKGRITVIAPGEAHPRSKLTAAAVREIRASDDAPTALARRYGVKPSTICHVQQGRTWRHVA